MLGGRNEAKKQRGLGNYRATLLRLPIYLIAEDAPTLYGEFDHRTRLVLPSKSSGHQET